jgi:uncharacterized membrane protein
MTTPANIGKHPIHPMIVVFPLGLLVFSFLCDMAFAFGTHARLWSILSFYTMAGGIVGGVLAAVPGLIDFLSIRDPQTKRIVWVHMLSNTSGLLFFILAWTTHYRNASTTRSSVALSALGLLALGVGGWLGGELVYVKGVGVEPTDAANNERTATSVRPESEPRMRRAS